MVKWVVQQISSHYHAEFIPKAHREQWIKIDAQLCSIIKSIIYSSLKPVFCPHKTCEFGVRFVPFIPMTYDMCQDLMTLAP